MAQRLKKIKKSTLVILVLLFLNLVLFYTVASNIKAQHPTTDTITTVNDNNTYFKAGVNVLDWSYTLLRYFRR
jgi:hypothetical protein